MKTTPIALTQQQRQNVSIAGNKRVEKEEIYGEGVVLLNEMPPAYVFDIDEDDETVYRFTAYTHYFPDTQGNLPPKEYEVAKPRKVYRISIKKASFTRPTDFNLVNVSDDSKTLEKGKVATIELMDYITSTLEKIAGSDLNDINILVVGLASPEFKQFDNPNDRKVANEILANIRAERVKKIMDILVSGGEVEIFGKRYKLSDDVIQKLKNKNINYEVKGIVKDAKDLPKARGVAIEVRGTGEKVSESEIPSTPKPQDNTSIYEFAKMLLPSLLQKAQDIPASFPKMEFFAGPFGKEAFVVNQISEGMKTTGENIQSISRRFENEVKETPEFILSSIAKIVDIVKNNPRYKEIVDAMFKPSPKQALETLSTLAKIQKDLASTKKTEKEMFAIDKKIQQNDELLKLRKQELLLKMKVLQKQLDKIEKGEKKDNLEKMIKFVNVLADSPFLLMNDKIYETTEELIRRTFDEFNIDNSEM